MTGEGKKESRYEVCSLKRNRRKAQKDASMIRENARDTSKINKNPVFPFSLSEILTNAINFPDLKKLWQVENID